MSNVNNVAHAIPEVFWNKRLSASRKFGVTSFYDTGKDHKKLPGYIPFRADSFNRYFNGDDFYSLNLFQSPVARERIMPVIEQSGLAGCGGAFFPVAQKWKAALENPGPRYLVVNAQEGEKYTYKDYFIMQQFPALVVEGAALAALALDAKEVFIIVNASYTDCMALLEQAAQRLNQSMPEINLKITVASGPSPDVYVCGEETALMQYMNGLRAEPQLRPPFPFESGYRGQPTIIHNVETIAWIPVLLQQPDLFSERGKLKLVHVWGDVNEPGIHEIALGTRLESLLALAGGMKKGSQLEAIEVGGMAGGLLPAAMRNLGYDHASMRAAGAMVGTGSVRFLDRHADLLNLSREATVFFRDESCGRCSACRVGTQVLSQLIDVIESGKVDGAVIAQIDDVTQAMVNGSICALGKGAPSHLQSWLKHWG